MPRLYWNKKIGETHDGISPIKILLYTQKLVLLGYHVVWQFY